VRSRRLRRRGTRGPGGCSSAPLPSTRPGRAARRCRASRLRVGRRSPPRVPTRRTRWRGAPRRAAAPPGSAPSPRTPPSPEAGGTGSGCRPTRTRGSTPYGGRSRWRGPRLGRRSVRDREGPGGGRGPGCSLWAWRGLGGVGRRRGSDGLLAALAEDLPNLVQGGLHLGEGGVHGERLLEVLCGLGQIVLLEVDEPEARQRPEVNRVALHDLFAVGEG